MAAAESSAGKLLKGETAASMQRAAGVVVESTGSDAWGDQHVSVRHRGCTVHWGPENSRKYLEVVLAAAAEVAAGTTVEAAADRVRAHVVEAIGEERLEPATARGATTESGRTELGEEAAAEAAKEKKREKQRRKKQRRRQNKETAAAAEAAAAGLVRVESEAAKAEAEAATAQIVKSAGAVARAQTTSAEEIVVDAARAAGAAEESVVEEKAAAAVSAEAEEKSTEKGTHAVWSDHIAENQYVERQAAIAEEAVGDPSVAGGAAVDLGIGIGLFNDSGLSGGSRGGKSSAALEGWQHVRSSELLVGSGGGQV